MYKFERNRPSIDYIDENKVLLTAMDVVQQIHQALLIQTLAQKLHDHNENTFTNYSPPLLMRS